MVIKVKAGVIFEGKVLTRRGMGEPFRMLEIYYICKSVSLFLLNENVLKIMGVAI